MLHFSRELSSTELVNTDISVILSLFTLSTLFLVVSPSLRMAVSHLTFLLLCFRADVNMRNAEETERKSNLLCGSMAPGKVAVFLKLYRCLRSQARRVLIPTRCRSEGDLDDKSGTRESSLCRTSGGLWHSSPENGFLVFSSSKFVKCPLFVYHFLIFISYGGGKTIYI